MMIADADSGNLAETPAERLSIWDLEIDQEDDAIGSSDCAWSIFHRVLVQRGRSWSDAPSARAADDGALETDDENQSFFSAFLESFSSLLFFKKKLIKNDDF
jgi:hypothetical protein